MILEVAQENNYFPVGSIFKYDEGLEAFMCVETHEEIEVDDGEVIIYNQYQISVPFYEANKEIFNQVKLEETQNEIQNIEGEKTPQNESENIHTPSESCYRHSSLRANSMCPPEENVQRKKVEAPKEASESEGPSVYEQRQNIYDRFATESGEEDQRAIRLAAVDRSLYNLIILLTQYRDQVERNVWDLRDAYEELRETLK